MSFIAPDVVAKAKQMDLLTYLSTYEPQELVHFGGGTYCTREHDSLKISNGKWYWFSRNIGGRSALDYLIKVKGIPFTEAVEEIVGRSTDQPVISPPAREPPKRTLLLPEVCRSSTRAANYLVGRGIDNEMIDFCISTGRLYESEKYHNVVFIGQDSSGKPRYANLRGTASDFKGEASGSDKRYSFSIPAGGPAALSTSLKAPSTCYPLPPCASWQDGTGELTTCFRWRAYIARERSCRKARCRWR